MAFDPVTAGLSGAGLLANYFAGNSAANASKEAQRRQAQLLQRQGQLFSQAQGFYQPLLQAYANQAGLGGMPGLTQTGAGQFQQMPTSHQFGLGGGYGSYEDQLRLQAAQEDIGRQTQQGANQLRFQLGQRGVAQGSIAAALARNQAQGDQSYAQFRRGLAIAAPHEQQQRLGILQNALGIGFGQGPSAAAGYGQQAATYGQQAGQAFGGIGNILNQYQYMQALKGYGQQPGTSGNALGSLGLTPEMLAQYPNTYP